MLVLFTSAGLRFKSWSQVKHTVTEVRTTDSEDDLLQDLQQ